MKLIRKRSKQTYTGSDGKEKHYYNFFIEGDNGRRVQVIPSFKDDKKILEAWASYER